MRGSDGEHDAVLYARMENHRGTLSGVLDLLRAQAVRPGGIYPPLLFRNARDGSGVEDNFKPEILLAR